jgi:hypothetical protein
MILFVLVVFVLKALSPGLSLELDDDAGEPLTEPPRAAEAAAAEVQAAMDFPLLLQTALSSVADVAPAAPAEIVTGADLVASSNFLCSAVCAGGSGESG